MKVKLDYYAFTPNRAHDTDAGIDILSPRDIDVPPRGFCVIDTGVHVELPKGTAGVLISKSGLNVKHGITSTGLIDEGYTGEIKVKLYNNGYNWYHVKAGDKITQLVVVPVLYEAIELVDELNGNTERGVAGFGSTGR